MASSTGQLPSFLPPDPKVEEPYLLTPRMAMRVAILGGIALIVFGVLFLRLWSLQILSPDKYRTAARREPAAAGHHRGAQGHDRRPARPRDRPRTSRRRRSWSGRPACREARAATRRSSELSKILDIPFWKLRQQIRAHQNDPLTPVTLKVAVSPEVMDYLDEHQSEFPGVDLKQTYLRSYPAEELFAQGLGYVGEVSAEQLKDLRKEGYVAGDRIGQSGVEAAFDQVLRGEDGLAELRVDSLGRPKSELLVTKIPKPGDSIRLTIDIALQRAAERAIQHGIALAHEDGEWSANGGSIVALDPNNGDILAMASYPTFRPSVFTGRAGEKQLAAAPRRRGREARELPGAEPRDRGDLSAGLDVQADHGARRAPGAPRRPVLAAALHGLVHGARRHRRRPGLPQLGPERRPADGDVGGDRGLVRHVLLPPRGRCSTTCRPSVGTRSRRWASRFGIGASTGVDIGPEERGILPTPEWRGGDVHGTRSTSSGSPATRSS